jgi:hypothetical protein
MKEPALIQIFGTLSYTKRGVNQYNIYIYIARQSTIHRYLMWKPKWDKTTKIYSTKLCSHQPIVTRFARTNLQETPISSFEHQLSNFCMNPPTTTVFTVTKPQETPVPSSKHEINNAYRNQPIVEMSAGTNLQKKTISLNF